MIKRTLFSALVSTGLASLCITSAFGAPPTKVANVVPKVSLIGTPEFQAQIAGLTAPKRARPPAPGEVKFWLEFEADFECSEDFPELQLKYGLLISMPGKQTKLIEGEVTHVDIGKGKDRHSVMYIAPKTLNKIAEGKGFTTNNIKAQWVEVYSAGELVGLGFKSNQVTYDQIQKGKDSVEKVADSLVNKQQTPFAPLFIDYYEPLKASR